jgi:hypothetical protein
VTTTGWTIERSGDEPVEFVIGMRWAQLWRLAARPWVPMAFARMLTTGRRPGLERTRFGVRRDGPVVVQRWRDRQAVDGWARASGEAHQAPWSRFAREAPGGTASWGIWHEVAPCA